MADWAVVWNIFLHYKVHLYEHSQWAVCVLKLIFKQIVWTYVFLEAYYFTVAASGASLTFFKLLSNISVVTLAQLAYGIFLHFLFSCLSEYIFGVNILSWNLNH